MQGLREIHVDARQRWCYFGDTIQPDQAVSTTTLKLPEELKQRIAADASHRVTLRYRSDWASVITPKHRIVYGTRVFDIESVQEVQQRGQLHVLVKERV